MRWWLGGLSIRPQLRCGGGGGGSRLVGAGSRLNGVSHGLMGVPWALFDGVRRSVSIDRLTWFVKSCSGLAGGWQDDDGGTSAFILSHDLVRR